MKTKVIWILFTGLFSVAAHAQQAQVLNPLYIQARDLLKELNSSSLNASGKTAWRARFNNLDATQKQLWGMAAQVDGGQCKDNCIDLYNSRVINWQSDLQRFIADAQATQRAQQNDPNTMARCQSANDREYTACMAACRDKPIDQNSACWSDCREDQIRGFNACVGK